MSPGTPRPAPGARTRMLSYVTDRAGCDRGFTVVEVLFALVLGTTVISVAIPSTRDAVDEIRTATAARYLAGRLAEARVSAVARSAGCHLCHSLRLMSVNFHRRILHDPIGRSRESISRDEMPILMGV